MIQWLQENWWFFFLSLLFAVVTESLYTDDDQHSLEGLSDISLEEDFLDKDGSNIFSDPESEWGMGKSAVVQIETTSSPPDSRPEVDQPSTSRI